MDFGRIKRDAHPIELPEWSKIERPIRQLVERAPKDFREYGQAEGPIEGQQNWVYNRIAQQGI